MSPEGSIFEGKTLDDAVRKGLETLRLTRAEAMITVLEEGKAGFLGIGARPYRVSVRARPGGALREPDEREGRRRDREGRGRGGRNGRDSRGERRRGEGPRDERRERRGRDEGGRDERRRRANGARDERRGGERRPEGARRPEAERPREIQPQPTEGAPAPMAAAGPGGAPPEGEAHRRRRRGRRGGRGRRREGEGERMPAPESAAPAAVGAEERVDIETVEAQADLATIPSAPAVVAPVHVAPAEARPAAPVGMSAAPAGMSDEALAAEARRVTEELLRAMGFEGSVTASAQEGHVDVMATVQADEELLTGRKGETRQALQHVLNRMINKGGGSQYHLQLEINDFWRHREEELADLARRLAEQAMQTQGEAVSEYLNAQERRIVHMTLRSDARVKTYALGTGLIKRVAVAPADHPEGPRDEE